MIICEIQKKISNPRKGNGHSNTWSTQTSTDESREEHHSLTSEMLYNYLEQSVEFSFIIYLFNTLLSQCDGAHL